MVGRTLNHYRVESKLGSGAMDEPLALSSIRSVSARERRM